MSARLTALNTALWLSICQTMRPQTNRSPGRCGKLFKQAGFWASELKSLTLSKKNPASRKLAGFEGD
jgi:hypothetical protein